MLDRQIDRKDGQPSTGGSRAIGQAISKTRLLNRKSITASSSSSLDNFHPSRSTKIRNLGSRFEGHTRKTRPIAKHDFEIESFCHFPCPAIMAVPLGSTAKHNHVPNWHGCDSHRASIPLGMECTLPENLFNSRVVSRFRIQVSQLNPPSEAAVTRSVRSRSYPRMLWP
jgi:hypothetical protein